METTLDGLLNRRLWLEQPAKGFRIAVDTVLLASAVPAKPGESVLELGCGVGGALLALGVRVQGVSVTGIEIQPELAELCAANIERNIPPPRRDDFRVLVGDATCLPDELGDFNHVMMNPPYHDRGRHDVSADPCRRMANAEREGDFPKWVKTAQKKLKKGGVLTLIHRADRTKKIIEILAENFDEILVKPIYSKESSKSKRVIIHTKKGQFAQRVCKPLVLHQKDGKYTDEAESLLRHAAEMEF